MTVRCLANDNQSLSVPSLRLVSCAWTIPLKIKRERRRTTGQIRTAWITTVSTKCYAHSSPRSSRSLAPTIKALHRKEWWQQDMHQVWPQLGAIPRLLHRRLPSDLTPLLLAANSHLRKSRRANSSKYSTLITTKRPKSKESCRNKRTMIWSYWSRMTSRFDRQPPKVVSGSFLCCP